MFIGTSIGIANSVRNSIKPTIDYNFQNSTQGLTFSRSSGCTIFDSLGNLSFAPENIIPNSNDFALGTWTKQGLTTGTQDGLGFTPIYETVDPVQHQISSAIATGTPPIGTIFTVSVDVVSVGGRWAYIGSNSAVFGAQEYCYFDLTTGVVGIKGTTVLNATITETGTHSNGNKIYRLVWTSYVTNPGGTPSFFVLSVRPTDNSRAPAYNGDVTKGLLLRNMQVQRGNSATTYVNTTTNPYYGPAIDYDSFTQSYKGLAIFETRSNLLIRSQEYSNVAWSKTDCSVSVNTLDTLCISGYNLASKITEGTANTALLVSTSTSITAGSTVVVSHFIKKGNFDWIRVRLIDAATSGDGYNVWFNLNTGTVGTIQTLGTGSQGEAGIQKLKNGRYRVWVSCIVSAGGTTATTHITSASGNGQTNRTSSGTYYLCGSQLEQILSSTVAGSTARMTNYIPTNSGGITRSGDVVSIALGSWFDQSKGTIVSSFDQSYINTNALARGVLLHFEGTNANNDRHYIFSNVGSAKIGMGTNLGGTQQSYFEILANSLSNTYKVAYAYNTNSFGGAVNNTDLGSDSIGTLPTIITVKVGNRGTDWMNGWIRNFKYFKSRLGNNLLLKNTI